MRPEIKAQWVAALRSGDYRQGRNQLRSVDASIQGTFCCLGVLCDLYIKDPLHRTAWIYSGNTTTDLFFAGSAGSLPQPVMQWAGLDRQNPNVPFKSTADKSPTLHSLAQLNDSHKLSFGQIADLIEEQL